MLAGTAQSLADCCQQVAVRVGVALLPGSVRLAKDKWYPRHHLDSRLLHKFSCTTPIQLHSLTHVQR